MGVGRPGRKLLLVSQTRDKGGLGHLLVTVDMVRTTQFLDTF